jgi:hypothetical protein
MATWAALGPFVGLINFFRSSRDRRDDRTRAALSCLSKALLETRIYLRDLEKGTKKNTKRENDLARLWTEAANELRDLDSQLAQICYYKSDYWTMPDDWSEHNIRKRGIAIDRIYETYRILLRAPDRSLDRGID